MDALRRLKSPWQANYIGLPYKARGRDKNGVDCWGLCWLIYKERLGIRLSTYGSISPLEVNRVVHAIEDGRRSGLWLKVELGEVKDLDFVIMKSAVRVDGVLVSLPVHIGLVIGKAVLHIQEGGTSILQPIVDLKPRIVEALRYKDHG